MKRIAAQLGVSVSSVSIWTRHIKLTESQRSKNLARAGAMRGQAWAVRFRNRRLQAQEEGRRRATQRKDPLHMSGCMLYWAEGTKDRNSASLCNSDVLREIEEYWLAALELPRACLRSHSLNPLPTSSSGRKRNKLPYGVCTVTVNETSVVQHIYGAIQEYAGFEEPRWLDGPSRKRRLRKKKLQ